MQDDLYRIDITEAAWTKPCGGNIDTDGDAESCVEFTRLAGGGIAIRDSKRSDIEPMRFTTAELTAFVRAVSV